MTTRNPIEEAVDDLIETMGGIVIATIFALGLSCLIGAGLMRIAIDLLG